VTKHGGRTPATRRLAWLAPMLALIGVPAWAGSGRVALVRSATTDSTVAEALHRMRGELAAEGFDVVDVDSPTDPAPSPGESNGQDIPLATIDLSVDEGTHVVELRVVDRLTNKTVVR
jgi:hypothetical protein